MGGYGNSNVAQEADVVIINMQSFSLSSIPWVRPPNQLWVGAYFESMGNYPVRGGEEVLQQFNYTFPYGSPTATRKQRGACGFYPSWR
jgi:hypothetical protein